MNLYLLRNRTKPHISLLVFRTIGALKDYLKEKHKVDKIGWNTNHGSDVVYSYVRAGINEYVTEIIQHTSKKNKQDIKQLYLVEGKCLKHWSEHSNKSYDTMSNENEVITSADTAKDFEIQYIEAKEELKKLGKKVKYDIWKRKTPVKVIK